MLTSVLASSRREGGWVSREPTGKGNELARRLGLLAPHHHHQQRSAAQRRAEDAGLDPDMVIERWDKTAKVHYDRRVLAELMTLRFIEGHRNVIVLGETFSPDLGAVREHAATWCREIAGERVQDFLLMVLSDDIARRQSR
jgi:hypothetical protein